MKNNSKTRLIKLIALFWLSSLTVLLPLAESSPDFEVEDGSLVETNCILGTNSWKYGTVNLTKGDTFEGYLTTENASQLMDFFVGNMTQFQFWIDQNNSSQFFQANHDFHSLKVDYSCLESGLYYYIFSNRNNSNSSLSFDCAFGVNGKKLPKYDRFHEFVKNGVILKPGESEIVFFNYLEDTVLIDLEFKCVFPMDGLNMYLVNGANFAQWRTKGYDLVPMLHFYNVSAVSHLYSIEHSQGYDLVVFSNQTDRDVYFSYYADTILKEGETDSNRQQNTGTFDDGGSIASFPLHLFLILSGSSVVFIAERKKYK
ncbi:hypothetical protein [Candidatus Lokiarchaeum ossiferum]|uniref:hypothetical protein n=1 Tax=Candidatus Lokiarchaeum ossiferum TaxID=2951803 RepID=UPI00352DC0F0